MVKFYKNETIEWEYNNIRYGEKIFQLRNLEDRLERDVEIYAEKYESAHDIDICEPDIGKDKWIKWRDAHRRVLIILCNYIIDKCHILIKSGDIAVPYGCKKESDLYGWFRENCRHLGMADPEYHQGGIDYTCQYYYRHRNRYMINKFTSRESISIEIENLSSNFIRHRHNVDDVDMIICYEKDIDIFYDNPKGEKVPILELNYSEKMQKLTSEEIEELANRPNVKKVAVENFLMDMGEDLIVAMGNLGLDAKYYIWNRQTVQAILDGILVASGIDKEVEPIYRDQKSLEEDFPILELNHQPKK